MCPSSDETQDFYRSSSAVEETPPPSSIFMKYFRLSSLSCPPQAIIFPKDSFNSPDQTVGFVIISS